MEEVPLCVDCNMPFGCECVDDEFHFTDGSNHMCPMGDGNQIVGVCFVAPAPGAAAAPAVVAVPEQQVIDTDTTVQDQLSENQPVSPNPTPNKLHCNECNTAYSCNCIQDTNHLPGTSWIYCMNEMRVAHIHDPKITSTTSTKDYWTVDQNISTLPVEEDEQSIEESVEEDEQFVEEHVEELIEEPVEPVDEQPIEGSVEDQSTLPVINVTIPKSGIAIKSIDIEVTPVDDKIGFRIQIIK